MKENQKQIKNLLELKPLTWKEHKEAEKNFQLCFKYKEVGI